MLPGADEFREIADIARIERQPLASVLMLTYNHEAHIAKAIEGVINQKTSFPFELIIGEDCSTDATRKIACQYQQRFPGIIRIIVSATNTGSRRNAKRIRDVARGKYVAYCEGDDSWHDAHKLQKQVTFLEANPDYGLVHSNYDALYVGKNLRIANWIHDAVLNDEDAFCEILTSKRVVITLTVCLRRSLLNEIVKEHNEIADPSWPMGDIQTWLEMARLAKVKYLPESLATHQYLPESATQSRDPERVYRFGVKMRELILHYINKYDCPPGVARQARAFNAVCLMQYAYYAGQGALMNGLLFDAKQHYRRIPLKNWLFYYGTTSRIAYHLVAPGVLLMKAIDKLRRICGIRDNLHRRPVKPYQAPKKPLR